MKNISIIVCCSLACFYAGAQEITRQQFKEDFLYFHSTIKDNYAYWDKKQTDWEKVKLTYSPQFDTVTSRASFIQLLEKVFYEIYDHHAGLSSNTPQSLRLVPTGTDIWAEYVNGHAVITEVRSGSGAEKAGIKERMQIVAFNDISTGSAIQPFLAKSLKKDDVEAKNFALRVLLAGKHSGARKITVKYNGRQLEFYPDQPVTSLEAHYYNGPVESRIINGNIGYIRINNSLGDNNVMAIFDSVLADLKNTKAIILDLRETPSGGNTTVARSILGSFISREGFYQKHELTSEERLYGVKQSWIEIVSPKKWHYNKPLYLLVDHWTGSVGEGITIGFDALKRAHIVGTKMAGLNGAVYSFTMPISGIGFSFPAEKLFHVNGTPREDFYPEIQPAFINKSNDAILATALSLINSAQKKN